MKRLFAAAVLVSALCCARLAHAGEQYAPLLRDLDRAGLLEDLISGAVATQWGALRAMVPPPERKKLLDPLTELAGKNLGRPETRALLEDLLALHEQGAVEPQLQAILRALDYKGPATDKLEALVSLVPVAERAGITNIARLASDVGTALEAAPLAEMAAAAAALPPETWKALDEISAATLDAGTARKLSEFLSSGSAPGYGLEPVRPFFPAALCALEETNLKKADEGFAYILEFVSGYPDQRLLISFVQWLAAQADKPDTQEFIVFSLSYPRLAELAAAHRTAIKSGVLKEVLLDYADFMAGTDRRVRVEPELWKNLQKGTNTEASDGGLSGIDLVKLGALTLYTVNRLDDVPSAPRADGKPQTLADELLDYVDAQLEAEGKKSAMSPLFDAVREFLTPSPERAILLRVARDFAAFMAKHDPAPLLAAVEASLGCDPEMKVARGVAALLDKDPANGDARMLTKLAGPFSMAPAEPLVPLIDFIKKTRAPARALAPAARKILSGEIENRTISAFAVGLGQGKTPPLIRLDPLLRGLLAEAPVFRAGLKHATKERIEQALQWARPAVAVDGKGHSDLSAALEALAAWSKYSNPVSGRPLLADGALLGVEALRSGLVETIFDAGVALRRQDPAGGVPRLLETLRAVIEPPVEKDKERVSRGK